MRPFNRIDYSGRYRPYRRQSRLPSWLRLFNRLLLIVLALFLLTLPFRCSCSADSATPESSEEVNPEDSLPESELPDTAQMAAAESTANLIATAPATSPDTGGAATDTGKVRDISHILSQKDTLLAMRIDIALRRYKPDGAMVLLVDGKSNEILAWGQRSDSLVQTKPTFLSRSTFPAASIIKIITAAAALESRRYTNQSTLPKIGRSTTLFRNQLRIPENHQGATITLEDAFARSANPAKGMIGQHLGGRALAKMGLRMGFDRHYPDGLPQYSHFSPPDTGFALAEAASGFTKSTTLSPLHAAAIAQVILSGKDMQIPWSHHLPKGFAPREPITLRGTALSEHTTEGLQAMMLRTVSHGTSARAMRKVLFGQTRQQVEIGGKTGSLDGLDPPGRYDWFVGYARSLQNPEQALVVVVMQIHGKMRSLPASSVAGWLINHWVRHNL